MTANDSTCYLPYLNKLVNEYNNTYHHSIHENADYSTSTENIKAKPQSPKFNVNDRVRISYYKNILVKFTLKNG